MSIKKNLLLFKIKLKNEEWQYNINNFIDLFLNEGPFETLLNKIFGIATHNFLLNIYNVTFNKGVDKKIIDDCYFHKF